MLNRIAFALALTLTVSPLLGCPKQVETVSVEELAIDPRANFTDGLRILQNPDKKTGAVDYGTAFIRFENAVNLGAGAHAAFNAAWVAEILNRPADAEKYYRMALEKDPAYKAALFSLARVLAQNGSGDAAVQVYKGYLESNPKDLDVRNDLIVALTSASRWDEAVAEANEVLRHDPKNAGAYRNLSAMYYAKGEYGMSQLANEKALQLNDADAGIYNNMGVTYLKQSDAQAAIERFKTAVKLDPTNYEANTNLGYIALNSGDYGLAKTSFEAATKKNPGSVEAKLGLAVALRGAQEYDRAGRLYDEIILADPGSFDGYSNASLLHQFYTKDFTKALEYLQKFVDGNAGKVSPSHQVFARMDEVKTAKAAEEERKRLEAEKKREEEERKKRNEATLKEMATVAQTYTEKFTANTDCLNTSAPGLVDEGSMMLEQVTIVVETQEIGMAGDIKMMLEGYVPVWDEALAACSGAAPAPAEPEPAPAPE